MLLAADASPDATRVTQLAQRCGVLVTERKKGDFHTKHVARHCSDARDVVQDMDRLLRLPAGVSAASLPAAALVHATAAWACLTSTLQLLGNDDNFNRFTLERYDLGQVRESSTSPLHFYPPPPPPCPLPCPAFPRHPIAIAKGSS